MSRLMALGLAAVVVLVSGCEKDKKTEPEPAAPARLVFGDCAGPEAPDFEELFEMGTVLGGGDGDPLNAFGPGVSSFFGTRDGGTDWGTIGTGNYGTIGRGSGIGSGGYGVPRRRGKPPQVRIGNATVDGDLDENIIRRSLRRRLRQIKYCYEKQLVVNPALQGTVVTHFTITPEGEVVGARADGVSREVSSCIAGVLAVIRYPKPKSGGIVQVRYPFAFEPGDAAPAAAIDAGVPVPAAAPQTPHVAGANNPLRAHAEELKDCLKGQSHGAGVVELTVGADGAVTAGRAIGLGGDAVETCVAALAKKIHWAAGAGATHRCAVAFGDDPVEPTRSRPAGP